MSVTSYYMTLLLVNQAYPQTSNPTIEDLYRIQLNIDNQISFLELIDTAGSGTVVQTPPNQSQPLTRESRRTQDPT
jgi:hypothetical protein